MERLSKDIALLQNSVDGYQSAFSEKDEAERKATGDILTSQYLMLFDRLELHQPGVVGHDADGHGRLDRVKFNDEDEAEEKADDEDSLALKQEMYGELDQKLTGILTLLEHKENTPKDEKTFHEEELLKKMAFLNPISVDNITNDIPGQDKADQALAKELIQKFIPSYVQPGSWQPWDFESDGPCPAGFTCTVMGNGTSFGAFSCDEMARIAVEEYGFGNVLAGIRCPEGQMGVLNCDRGNYCPNSTSIIACPAGKFCPYKTSEPTIVGGSVPCNSCPVGSEDKSLSKTQKTIQVVILVILSLLLIMKIVKRKAKKSQEKLKQKLHLDSIKSFRFPTSISSKTEVKREEEKYARLRVKLEVIANRLDKIRQEKGSEESSMKPFLQIRKNGSIVFDANEFYNVLDTDNNGILSFSEINKVLDLSDEQLRAFVFQMTNQMPADFRPAEKDEVYRATFVKNFLDVLADASQLEPTVEEVEDLFVRISDEVGTTESGEVLYETLYGCSSLSFLSDLQVYEIIRRFKEQGLAPSSSTSTRLLGSMIGGKNQGMSKDDFVNFYARFLGEVSQPDFQGVKAKGGLDVAFKDLNLTVTVAGKQVNVVDSVTGRLRSNTMTAVMGGSGSGKSSLLNALCGRAFYGTVTGTIKINGNDSLIEEHKAVIGFVPQDDIVFPDLTVRENLLYSGRLLLPSGTTEQEISELADATMASLGLSRIANSLVGDATRRGVSGGEKKRVNIGLELMKKPKILFLDEPTSGLDSRSAFVVMDSLRRLVNTQGMTVASVIHQPRTDIYDMFDSLFLLGVGGCTVYHGPGTEARAYFQNLGFKMQQGESQADWFLDISSGDVEPSVDVEVGVTAESDNLEEESAEDDGNLGQEDGTLAKARLVRENLYRQFLAHFDNLPSVQRAEIYDPPDAFDLPVSPKAVPSWLQFVVQLRRNTLLSWRNRDSRIIDFGVLMIAVFLMTLLGGNQPKNWVGNPGSVGCSQNPPTCENTSDALLIPAVLLLSFLQDLLWIKFIAGPGDASSMLNPLVFRYAIGGLGSVITYSMMVGLVLSVLIGLNTTKIITEKRLEFYREAQSNANTTAYYVAATVTTTIEQGFSAFVGSVLAYLILNPSASFVVYLWNFFMLSWLSVSWALLLSIIVPPKSVSTVVSFFMAFFGLLFCGQTQPGTFKALYSSPAMAVFAGFVSPLRFFVEGIGVSEARCLPQQSGYTVADEAFNYPEYEQSYPYAFDRTFMARADASTSTVQSCSGWFWWVPASLVVGITIRIAGVVAMHLSNRPKQGKKTIRTEIVDDFNKCRSGKKSIFQSFILIGILLFLVFSGFFALSCLLILRENPETFSRFVRAATE